MFGEGYRPEAEDETSGAGADQENPEAAVEGNEGNEGFTFDIAQTWEELDMLVDSIESLPGSKKIYTSDELKEKIANARANSNKLGSVTSTAGLRATVRRLLIAERMEAETSPFSNIRTADEFEAAVMERGSLPTSTMGESNESEGVVAAFRDAMEAFRNGDGEKYRHELRYIPNGQGARDVAIEIIESGGEREVTAGNLGSAEKGNEAGYEVVTIDNARSTEEILAVVGYKSQFEGRDSEELVELIKRAKNASSVAERAGILNHDLPKTLADNCMRVWRVEEGWDTGGERQANVGNQESVERGELVNLENAQHIDELLALARRQQVWPGGYTQEGVIRLLETMKSDYEQLDTGSARGTWLGIMNRKEIPPEYADAAFQVWKKMHADKKAA